MNEEAILQLECLILLDQLSRAVEASETPADLQGKAADVSFFPAPTTVCKLTRRLVKPD